MSSATAVAVAIASHSWQRPFFPFTTPFSPLQTPLPCRKFLCLSLPRLVSSHSRLAAEAAPATAPEVETEKKRILIINTNSGGHAVIGFYFASELLRAGHEVTILTVGDEGSDKMKKPPFTRFSVDSDSVASFLFEEISGSYAGSYLLFWLVLQELVSAGARTIWGDPADVGKVVGSAAFDVVLDNNGKDLDTLEPVADSAPNT